MELFLHEQKLDAQEITERLVKEGYDIEALHGDLTQQQRDKRDATISPEKHPDIDCHRCGSKRN